jgi:D-alanyl-D-alanine carboxypeptidase
VQNKPEIYTGIKTGVTTTAGPCLASCVESNGRRFIIIVLNCKGMKNRMRDTEVLRKWLFQKEGLRLEEKVLMEEIPTA